MVETPWFPVLEGAWTYDAGSKKVRIELTQTQPGNAYQLPLEIGLGIRQSTQRIEKIDFRDKHQVFEIPADESPSAVTVDPNTWVLMSAHLVKR